MSPLAEAVDVTKTFGSLTAVKDVNLVVHPGEIVGLLGANGAGKTTLIKMVLGLVTASSGAIRLFGQPPSRQTRSRLGYVPQGLGLYDDLTTAENLAFTAKVFGAGPRGDDPPHPPGLRRFHEPKDAPLPDGIKQYANDLIGSLSLGTQRRVAFAQALSHKPDLLILDEPTSGVDPLGRARLWETIADAADAGVGVLVTTHHMEEAGECGRLVIMADGVVVAAGTAAAIIGSTQVTLVEADSWADAFSRCEAAGLQVALAGRGVRVPGADPARVKLALGDLPGARVREVPATLEERFFELVR